MYEILLVPALLAASALADDGTGNETCDFDVADLPECPVSETDLLPDLMTVVPKHLSIQNEHQEEMLRFSNGIANVGVGPWWLEPDFPSDESTTHCQGAYQVIVGGDQFPDRQLQTDGYTIPAPAGSYSVRCQKGNFDYHETHNHWHIDNVGEFKVCAEDAFDAFGADCDPATTSSGEPTVGIKYTFCLIDWYKLADNTASSDDTRNFFECNSGMQGITPGWVDQYHQATDGQEIDITGLPGGAYVLVSTVNGGTLDGTPVYEESNLANNTSYVRFELDRSSSGNAQIRDEVGSCDDDPDYLASVAAAAESFTTTYEGGEAIFEAELVEDLCGGKPANR